MEIRMAIAIPSDLTDDNEFTHVLNAMLKTLVDREAPGTVWVIRIDNWFDHKWLRFSGYSTTALSRRKGPVDPWDVLAERFRDTVKVGVSQDNLTFPPFTPERITGQWSFQRSGSGYVEAALPKMPHDTNRRPSYSNLQRRVKDHGGSALFVWFSGNTLKNGRGSVMVYATGARLPVCWFASLSRNGQWMIQKTKGIEREAAMRTIFKTT